MSIELRITAESAEDLKAQLAALTNQTQETVKLDGSSLVKAQEELAEMKEKAKREKPAKKESTPSKKEAKAEPKSEPAEKKEEKKEEAKAGKSDDKQPSIEDVREVMGKAVQNGEKDTIKDLFQKFDASKLSELDPSNYQAFINGLEAVLSK